MSDLGCCDENLSAYLDGELSTEEASVLESHLKTCAQCRESLNKMLMLSSAVWQIPRPVASPLLATQILSRIQTTEIYTDTPLNKLLQSWGLLSLFVLSTVVILFGTVLLEIMSVIVKHLAIVTSLVVKLSRQLTLDSTNMTLGLVLIVGAMAAFYGFGRVYSALSREGLTS